MFDKLADTILAPLEQWIRLTLALKVLGTDDDSAEEDPFPQDRLEFELRLDGGAAVDWLDSLRGRIRTCRGLAVFGPPASLGAASLFADVSTYWDLLPSVVTIVAVLLAIALAHSRRLSLPRTDHVDLRSPTPEMRKRWRRSLRLRMVPLLLIVTVSSLLSMLNGATSWSSVGLLSLAGLTLGLLALWAWGRRTRTHMEFVRMASCQGRKIYWDGPDMRVTNDEYANQSLTGESREGFGM